MDKLWEFIDDKGTFRSDSADRIKTLYFPLCNPSPFMSSVTPDLHGDIKVNFNAFLLEPVSRLSLSNSKSSRNFWIYINAKNAWSATGVSKDILTPKEDKFKLEAGLLWHKITRQNKRLGLKADITSFVPASGEPVELMLVKITNISKNELKFIATAALPLYGRSANNLHDHRHVTSLLNRVQLVKFGIILKPTLLFDESGHKKNNNSYFVFGVDEKEKGPQYLYPSQEDFTGESSDLEAPDAVFKNRPPLKNTAIQGKEAMAGLKFKSCTLKPKQTASYIVVMGVNDESGINRIFKKFNSKEKVIHALEATQLHWQRKSEEIKINTANTDFDNWLRWINIQPILRKIFGCSFLPDFDYGKGGRGWRDLWQDSLYLILNSPKEVRPLLINNFSGVRIDGSNATIIGQRPGEFIADRNNISRVWMDHGAWPLVTTHLYIHQTGDIRILLEETAYFGEVYKGTILEHILIENLVQFFNTGPYNNIRLEGGDWNDGLDMAAQYGESVAFSCMYAQNLNSLCELIKLLGEENIVILKELSTLIDPAGSVKLDYSDKDAKRRLLDEYFQNTKNGVSGERISIPKDKIVHNLKEKYNWMAEHIRNQEWLSEGFFNGYYDNNKRRVEGKINGLMRMTLTGQVFPIMSGIATDAQIKTLFSNIKKYLKDRKSGGFHLNTDFKDEQPNLGRAFSFIYGDKENGAFFNHMSTMFAYALYKRSFVNEGYEVISSIFEMALDTAKSKIYPCLPEYFNAGGKGMYSYLTGSASWFILTLLTQAFGIRGEYGNLRIEPKLVREQFKKSDTISITAFFADKPIEVRFKNPKRKNFGDYAIQKAELNAKAFTEGLNDKYVLFNRSTISSLPGQTNIIALTLD